MTSASRIVVVSPHSDDGVLSLGASMARWAARGRARRAPDGARARPGLGRADEGWDRRAGFATEGEAARARREEDRVACAPARRHAALASVRERRLRAPRRRRRRVGAPCARSSTERSVVLVPGSPLSHPDHAWLNGLLASRVPAEALGLYAEQPYTLAPAARRSREATLSAARPGREVARRSARTGLSFRCSGCGGSLRRGALRLALGGREDRLARPLGCACDEARHDAPRARRGRHRRRADRVPPRRRRRLRRGDGQPLAGRDDARSSSATRAKGISTSFASPATTYARASG